MAACRGMHRYNGEARFSTWLTTIGIRTAYRRFRSADREDPITDDTPVDPIDDATVLDLERAMSQLTDRQRAVVVLHDIEGYKHEEIASVLGMSVATSKVTLFRARTALRRLLREGAINAT